MTTDRRHPNVINRDEVKPFPMEKGKHRVKMQRLGQPAGGQLLGGNLTELAPGSVSFPFHYHCATEEAIYNSLFRATDVRDVKEIAIDEVLRAIEEGSKAQWRKGSKRQPVPL